MSIAEHMIIGAGVLLAIAGVLTLVTKNISILKWAIPMQKDEPEDEYIKRAVKLVFLFAGGALVIWLLNVF